MKKILKVCHLSDTLNYHTGVNTKDMAKCDVVLFSGNCTKGGYTDQFLDFMNWFADLPVKYKVFIAGNRDYCLQVKDAVVRSTIDSFTSETNFYLQESACIIEGWKIYGTPYSMYVSRETGAISAGGNNFIYYSEETARRDKWDAIPPYIDILLTCTPPYNILDHLGEEQIGSKGLQETIETLSDLKLHCFGRAQEHGIVDTFNVRYSNGNVLASKDLVKHSVPTLLEIEHD